MQRVQRHSVGCRFDGLSNRCSECVIAAVPNTDPVKSAENDGLSGTDQHDTSCRKRRHDFHRRRNIPVAER